MQRLTIAHSGWDEALDDHEQRWWDRWLKKLGELEGVKIPRCLRPGGHGNTDFEIHVFCDASEEAFAGMAYLRTVTAEGRASSNIIMAKTRVAPK